MRVLIIGAGGHAKVVADVIASRRSNGEDYEIVGFLDDDPDVAAAANDPIRVLGDVSRIGEFCHDAIVVAIGDNKTRASIFDDLVSQGEHVMTVVHPRATVSPDVEIGDGTVIFGGAVINPGTRLGPNVIVNTSASVDHDNIIGAHTHLAPGVHLGGTVVVGEGAFVGIGSSVLPNRYVGPWSVVGAGAVVIRDVPASITVAGVPARAISQR